ncbi:unnamed protein product [Durusdinium trenchii]|uniref:Uncharacterized protein n=1 Tax=Durusdinium trenchii TaxID=1381693 RepID=A0ABP0SW37_9DINO
MCMPGIGGDGDLMRQQFLMQMYMAITAALDPRDNDGHENWDDEPSHPSTSEPAALRESCQPYSECCRKEKPSWFMIIVMMILIAFVCASRLLACVVCAVRFADLL